MDDYPTLAGIRKDLFSGKTSCRSLVDNYLHKIRIRPEINAFVEVYETEAIEAATRVDMKIREATAGRLAGLVIGIKDVICYAGHGLTAGSAILKGFNSLISATAVERLLAEDAIIIGRQNCDEFGMGSSNENSIYGPSRNPDNTDKVPGGSSGGSAAAVAAGFCHAALGSDTGGSVRQPSSFCGTVGLKPSYGRISRWGLIAYASSFDQIGIISKSVEDAALMLEIMAGPDGRDNTASSQTIDPYSTHILEKPQTSYIVGYMKEALESPGLNPEVREVALDSIEKLRSMGHEVREMAFPFLSNVVPCYYLLTTAEASSNLSRYDGVRYGHRSDNTDSLDDMYRVSRVEGFGDEVKRRILLGTFVLSAGYYDAYYTKAMKVRRLIRDYTLDLFKKCDFLLTPTAPTAAYSIGEMSDDPISMYLGDIYTVHANLAGIPAISLPMGRQSDGLSVGLQFMGKPFDEARLLHLSHSLMNQV